MKEERVYKVYMHTNLINNKKYIGITKQNLNARFKNGKGYVECDRFWNAIQKYGWSNFKHEILLCNLTKEQAEMFEIGLIKYYKSNNDNFGYNISAGGGIISDDRYGYKNPMYGKNQSSETRKRISDAQKGRKNHMYGKHISEEVKNKIRKSQNLNKKVICIETGEIFDSIRCAGKKLELHHQTIGEVCRGKHKTTGGLHFKYYEDLK